MSDEAATAPARAQARADASTARGRLPAGPPPASVAALLVIAGAAVLLLVASRGTWFHLDEWDFAVRAADLSADSILNPQNQNWHSTAVLVYRALLDLFGFSQYLPFRLLATALVGALGMLGYLYARRRVGPWWALLPAALLMVSPSFEVLVWPFQMGQLLSGVAGVGALLLLDRAPTRTNRVVASVLLIVAVASSSAGVPLVAVVVYDRLLRRGRRLEALVALPAIAAYALWWAEYGTREPRPNRFNLDAWNAAVDRAVDIGDGVVQSLLGLGTQHGAKAAILGQIGLAVLVVLVCWRIFGRHSQGRERVVALSGGLVTYWCLLAWGRASLPGIEVSGRYLFLSQVLIVLLLVEVAVGVGAWLRERGARGRPGALAPAAGGVAVVVVGALALLHNARTELDYGGILRENARAMRGQVYGLALLEGERRAGATVFLEPLGRQIGRPATAFFATLDRFDGPSPTEADVRALPPDGRARADQALFATYVAAQPAPGDLPFAGPPPEARLLASGQARLRRSGPCVAMRSTQEPPVLLGVTVPGSGMAVENTAEGPLTILARRYASDWDGPAKLDVPPDATVPVLLPADRGSLPWAIRIAGEAGRICSLEGR